MRLKGMFTIEAAVIFSLLTAILVEFLNLTFDLHDRVVSDSCKVQAGIRKYEMNNFYYDVDSNSISYTSIIASKLTEDDDYGENNESKLYAKVQTYYKENMLGQVEYKDTLDFDEIITAEKNASLLRKGGRAMQVVGEIIDGD